MGHCCLRNNMGLRVVYRLITVVVLGLGVFVCLNQASASAHPNAIDWSPCNGQYPPNGTGKQTAWSLVDNTYSSYSGYIGDTITATLKLEARGCHGQFAFNSRYLISGQNINNFSGQFQYDIGTVGLYGWTPNVHYQTAQFTIQAGDYGTTNHCVSWNAGGYYNAFNNSNGPFQFDGTATDTWCFTVYNQGNRPIPKATAYISKYEDLSHPANGYYADNTAAVNNAGVCLTNAGGNTFQCSQANPLVNNGLWVLAGHNPYTISIDVPIGYRVVKVTSRGNNRAPSCTGQYNTGNCRIDVIFTGDGDFMYVDWFLEAHPVGNFESLSCDASIPSSPVLRASGWAFDQSHLSSKIGVAFWEGNAKDPTRNLNFTATADGNGRNGEQYNNISIGGHLFSVSLPNSLNDGNGHWIYAYALGVNRNGSQDGDNQFIGKQFINTSTCQPTPSFYPWLQTKFGNVLAQGFVQGQQLDQAGSRPAGSTDKEATNLVIASVVARPFCSNNLYALGTSPIGQRQGCTSGGYSVNANVSAVQGALTEAWQQNGGGSNISCNPRFATKVLTTGAKVGANISPGCNNGTIYKTAASKLSDVLSSTTITDGRATIWAAPSGRVFTIDATLANGYGSYSDPKRIPNLAIFVDGDVEINSNVSQLDVSIISTGIIKSCGTNYVSGAPNCNNQLQVHGFWLANAFHFGRNYFNQADPSNNPAELFVQTGQSIAFPPPGLDQTYGGDDSLIIRREDNPRLQ